MPSQCQEGFGTEQLSRLYCYTTLILLMKAYVCAWHTCLSSCSLVAVDSRMGVSSQPGPMKGNPSVIGHRL